MLKIYFILWHKITTLIIKIYLRERYLSKYPDLNKFKRKDQSYFRQKIKFKRGKLKDLKNEVEMYAYYIKNQSW